MQVKHTVDITYSIQQWSVWV